MLILDDVTKKYGKNLILENINLEFSNGVYGILAPNGTGKTTLLKLIATLLFPTTGEILWNGTNILKLDEKYREIIGYLPQKFGYYKDFSVKKYLLYLSSLKGIDKKISEQRIDELLELMGIYDIKNKKLKHLSGGTIQRIGIVKTMLNEPKILILDEPTVGLDPKERVRFRNIITSLSKDKIIIISSHIVSDIEFIANKVIMIKDKKIICNDSTKNIYNTLSGKVFEMCIDNKDYQNVLNDYLLLSQRQQNDKIIVRFYSNTNNGFNPVIPNLEDVFLYTYRN